MREILCRGKIENSIGRSDMIGKLYMNGTELSDITDAELTPIVDEQSSGNKLRGLFNEPAEITCEMHINPKMFWLLCTGKRISNNWLKLHGGVMSRAGYGRKRKERRKI